MMRRTLAMGMAAMGMATPAATAGAWTWPAGQGQIIAEASSSDAGHQLGSDDYVRFRKSYLKDLYEYAANDDTTLISEVDYVATHVRTSNAQDTAHDYGFTVGARYRVFASPGVLSVQGSYTLSQPFTVAASEDHSTGNAAEFRLLYGTNFILGGGRGFADLETAWRKTASPRPNEAVFDATAGYWLTAATMAMIQSFNTFSAGYGRDGKSYHLEKIKLSLVQRIFSGWSVQLGGVATVAGNHVVAERGLTLSLWIDV